MKLAVLIPSTVLALAVLQFALADDFKTINGKEYKNPKVSRIEPDGIVITFSGGIVKIPFVELSPEIQKQYGYDRQATIQEKAAPQPNAFASPTDFRRAAGLMLLAETALRKDQFGRGAEFLNQIVSEYPSSPQAQTVRELCLFLRDKQPTQDGPLTSDEAQRLRAVMDALAKIKQNYRTATPEKRRALETILGAETFRNTDNGLDSVSSSGAKLRDSVDKARQGQ